VRAFDPAGAVTITAALALFVYAVSQAPGHGWQSSRTVAPLALSLILVAVFGLIESRSPTPLLPLRILRSRTLVGGNLIGVVGGMIAYGQGFLLTQYTQQVLHWSAARYGLLTVVMPVSAVVGSMVGQHLVTRLGFRTVAAGSMVLLALSCMLLTSLSGHGNYVREILPGLLLCGPGVGAGTVAAAIAAVAGVSERDSGLASGLSNMSFQVGGALGIAVLSTVAISHAAGSHSPSVLAASFGYAFGAGAVIAVAGLAITLVLLRRASQSPTSRAKITASELSRS
jgi:predicted MFS family arabinose efflux permease